MKTVTITLHKGTSVWKDVSGGLGQALLLCTLLKDVTVEINHRWEFQLGDNKYHVYHPKHL